MSLLKLGFDGRYWDSLQCTIFIRNQHLWKKEARYWIGHRMKLDCDACLTKPLPISVITVRTLEWGLPVRGNWASLLSLCTPPCLVTGCGLQFRWTLKEVKFGSCLLTVLIAVPPSMKGELDHASLWLLQTVVCLWSVLPQRSVYFGC